MYDSIEGKMGGYWFHVIRDGVTTSIAADVERPRQGPQSDGRYVLLEDHDNMDYKILYDIGRDLLVDIDMPAEVSFLGFVGDRMVFQPEDVWDEAWYSTPANYESTLYWVDLE